MFGEKGKLEKKKRKIAVVLLGLILICMCFVIQPHRVRGLEITMLDVGQGECICMRLPDGTTLLSDGGSLDISKVGQYRIKPFLLSGGISRIDAVLVSHWDEDHISGIRELMAENGRALTIKRLILPEANPFDETYEELVCEAKAAGVEVQTICAGGQLVCGDTIFTCLWPESGAAVGETNGYSAVYMLKYGAFRMLLTGDLPGEYEKELIEQNDLSCQVLKVAHHGSEHSTSAQFLDAAHPSLALISCGEHNRYGHPSEALKQRLLQAGCRYETTAKQGAVRLCVQKDGRCNMMFGQDSPFKTLLRRSASTSIAFSSS